MYVFDNAATEAPARLAALTEAFDPGTIRHLEARGIAEGWKCLEIGGGLGTMTRWLAIRVAQAGHVVTTDIDTRYLDTEELPNVEIWRHDIVEQDLPTDIFDLAYTRLVLSHLSNPQHALAKMARAIRSGGWVVVEDFEVWPGPNPADGPDAAATSKTAWAMRNVIAAAGADMRLGRSLPHRLRAAGLTDVGAEGRVFLWRGRSTGATLMRLNFEQLRDPILTTGQVTAEEYAADLARLDDEDFEIRSPILWTAWGRRPTP